MLLGQHWIVWSDLRGRYVDMASQLKDDERRWRHMPVLNRIFLWWILTHARMNENPPIITWQPGPDRIDAELAEVMDPIFKHLWREALMPEVLDRMISWMIPAGTAYLKSRIDPSLGDAIEARGEGQLDLLGPEGSPILGPDGQPISRQFPDLPLGEDGQPRAQLTGSPEDPQLQADDPFVFNEGGLVVDVLTCLEVRGEWGEHIPWNRKHWHQHRSMITPLQAYETFGIELEPDVRGEEAEDVGILWRVLHGSGLFGAAGRNTGLQLDTSDSQEFCTIYECWQRPGRFPGTQRTKESHGGRLTIVAGDGTVIRDGTRFAPFKNTSPIRRFDFHNLPGRPSGTSPQEMINGPIRTRNRLAAQELGHATLTANPVRLLDRGSGIKEGQIRNLPGEEVLVDRKPNQVPMEYVQPPRMGPEVSQAFQRLTGEVDQLASVSGTEGAAPTSDASGELVKELRFNADRPLASPLKRMVTELARMAEDWRVMVPLFWDEEKVIQVVGEDDITRTITVYPHLFETGTINAEPEIESMLPEGRGERQNRIYRFWQDGVWGPPDSPTAINTFLDLARFPHMSNATRPGGQDRATAERNVGRMLQGEPAAAIPVFDWYDHGIHQFVIERFMKSPEYLKQDPGVQQEMVFFRQKLLAAQVQTQLQQTRRELEVAARTQGAAALAENEVAKEIGGDSRDPTEPMEGRPRSARERPDESPTAVA